MMTARARLLCSGRQGIVSANPFGAALPTRATSRAISMGSFSMGSAKAAGGRASSTLSSSKTSRAISMGSGSGRSKPAGGRASSTLSSSTSTWSPSFTSRMLTSSAILQTVPGALTFLDYLGTAAFAASGCLVAGEAGMDTLGCCFVGTITALGGGTVRDLLLGRLPVFWFTQTSFLGLSIATGLATFFATESLESAGLLRSDALFIGDTLGLGAFAIVGAQAAISVGSGIAVASLCGMLTATCGGLIRDVLCARKNQGILYSGEGEYGALYAPTALAGAAFYSSLALYSSVAPQVSIVLGVGATIAMRLGAFSYRVRLPSMERYLTTTQESAPQPGLAPLGQEHLFVTAYGPDALGHVAAISRCISAARANISASKIITIGNDIAFMMVVSAPTDVVASFGKALQEVAEQRGLRTISEQAETGVSRSLRTQAEGDLFCLSAIVSTDQQLDEEKLAREIAKLEKKHRVTLKLAWLADDTD